MGNRLGHKNSHRITKIDEKFKSNNEDLNKRPNTKINCKIFIR